MQDGLVSAENDSLLFSPIELRSVTARNRVVASPMCQYLSHDGSPNDWQLVHLGRLAIGGCGIVFGEETAVEPRGRKTHACAGLYNDGHVAEYRRINDFLRANGSVPAIQLGHSGRKGSVHDAMKDWTPLTPEDEADGLAMWQPLGPSAIPQAKGANVPKEMTTADIEDVINAFVVATKRSLQAEYDICEVHGAHGYLIHQFLSPVSNQRTDGYGGSRENRMRLALEITKEVRAAWPDDKPLFYRLSAVDGVGGEWNTEDSIALACCLKDLGVDIVDCSSGGISGSASMSLVPRLPGFQVPFSERIKKEADVRTMAVGLITDGDQAETVLRDGQADLIAMARELMWYADWPAHMARKIGDFSYGLMPEHYAHRLQLRDRQAQMAQNQPTEENYAVLSGLVGQDVPLPSRD